MKYTEARRAKRRRALHNYLKKHNPKYIVLPSEMQSILQTEYNGNLSNAKKDAGLPQKNLEEQENALLEDELEEFGKYVREMEGRGISVTKTFIESDGIFAWLLNRYKGRVNDLKRDAGVGEYINSRKGSKNKVSRPDITRREKKRK